MGKSYLVEKNYFLISFYEIYLFYYKGSICIFVYMILLGILCVS